MPLIAVFQNIPIPSLRPQLPENVTGARAIRFFWF
jgi:hypothetical protein